MMTIVVGFFVLGGSLLFMVAAIGVVRLPDTYMRMHAASKASSLAIGLILFGAALHVGSALVFFKAMATIFFVFLTTPVAAHVLSRAARLSGAKVWEATQIDELGAYYSKSLKIDSSRINHASDSIVDPNGHSNGDFAIHTRDVSEQQDPSGHG